MAGVPVGAVAALHQAAVQEQAVAAGQAGMLARQLQQARDQARHHGLAVGAGHADHRDAAAVVLLGLGEQVVDDGAANRTRRAFGRLDVHQQARTGVDLDDGAALFGQRARDVLGHQVHAGDVQSNHARGQRRLRGHARVDAVGHVEGDVAVALDQHGAALGRHRAAIHALALQLQPRGGIQAHAVQRMVFGVAPPRIGIDLQLDQRVDGGLAVTDHAGGLAHRGGDQAAAHHQQAVFVAGNEALDDDAAAFVQRHGVGSLDFLAGDQVGKDAAAMVAVIGLHHHRHADVFGGIPGVLRRVDHAAFRHQHAARLEQALGQVLVARDAFADGAGPVGLGRPDAALARAIAQLDQVAVRQADGGDVAVVSGVDDARGAGAEAVLIDQAAQVVHGGGDVEGTILDRGHDQVARAEQGGAGDFLVPGTDDHLVDAAHRGFARLAEAAGHARQVLQLKRHVFQDMAGPGAAQRHDIENLNVLLFH
ncbi:hypothetical protein D9M69_385210 [compost metagenome]